MALYTASESPAIITREVDLTNGVPNVPTSTGAFVGAFRWGPIDQPVLINNEATLASTFGNPDKERSVDFHSASYYLRYSDDLMVVREIAEAAGTPQAPAIATVTLTNGDSGEISAITISENGSYTSTPAVSINAADSGTTPTLGVTYDATDDDVTAVTFSGSGYRYNSIPTITFTGGRADFACNAYDPTGNDAGKSAPEDLPVVKNVDNFNNQTAEFISDRHTFIAKWPGTLGNSIKISYCAANSAAFAAWQYKAYFDAAPGTSNFASDRSCTNDEIHVIVVDEDGELSGTVGEILETYQFLSLANNAKNTDGSTNYVVNVMNAVSKYIWIVDFPDALGANAKSATVAGKDFIAGVSQANAVHTASMVNGDEGGALTASDYETGFNNFNDVNTNLVDFLIAPGMSSAANQATVVNDLVTTAASLRKDCIVVASPNRAAIVDNPSAARANIISAQGTNPFTRSSYLFVDTNYLKVYDKFNDEFIFIPAASSTAGIMAATDNTDAPWFSPAGTRRGRYFGVANLAYSPSKSDRDELFKAGMNPIANIPGQGILLYGDKTHLSRPSAFDRVNVRRLFLTLERAIATAAQNVLFEFNDEFTRAEFTNIIEPVLRNVQGRRGITDFKLVCDATNNTSAIVDTNQFVANIFIKPARSVNFVTLNFVAVRSGVTFEEVVGENNINAAA